MADYNTKTNSEIETAVRSIIRSSQSDSEIQEKIQKDLGYPYGKVAISSHVPNDRIGREAKVLVCALGGLIRGDGAMVMIMMYGPNGDTISV